MTGLWEIAVEIWILQHRIIYELLRVISECLFLISDKATFVWRKAGQSYSFIWHQTTRFYNSD